MFCVMYRMDVLIKDEHRAVQVIIGWKDKLHKIGWRLTILSDFNEGNPVMGDCIDPQKSGNNN